MVEAGAIGDIVSIQADLGITREAYDPSHRLFAPELGGGALRDLGVYLVSFAQMLLGEPRSVHAVGAHEPNGVEGAASLLVGFGGGRGAMLTMSFHSPMPGAARIFGTRGRLEVPPRFHHPKSVVLHRDGREPERFEAPPTGAGYAHELIEVTRCVRAGRTESSVMPLDDTLAVMAVLEEAGARLGVTWSEDHQVDV
jgi:predicted dehydrogenase